MPLTLSQVKALGALSSGPLTVSGLCSRTGLSAPMMNHALKVLVYRGLADKAGASWSATEIGRRVIAAPALKDYRL